MLAVAASTAFAKYYLHHSSSLRCSMRAFISLAMVITFIVLLAIRFIFSRIHRVTDELAGCYSLKLTNLLFNHFFGSHLLSAFIYEPEKISAGLKSGKVDGALAVSKLLVADKPPVDVADFQLQFA